MARALDIQDIIDNCSHSVTIRNVYKPRTVRIGDFNGWREDGSRNFGFSTASDARAFLRACGYVRQPAFFGVQHGERAVLAFDGWKHGNGTYAFIHDLYIV